MTHEEHIALIKKGVTKEGGVWADLGSGDGAFTLALRDLVGHKVEIYSIDKDQVRLNKQQQVFAEKFPQTHIHFIQQDFTNKLNLPLLDGVVLANSLHYVKNQTDFLISLKQHMKANSTLLIIEYNIDTGNPWVPYPVSFETFVQLMKRTGFIKPQLLEKIPSSYWDEMYSAKAENS